MRLSVCLDTKASLPRQLPCSHHTPPHRNMRFMQRIGE
jgi:hypothetical protein